MDIINIGMEATKQEYCARCKNYKSPDEFTRRGKMWKQCNECAATKARFQQQYNARDRADPEKHKQMLESKRKYHQDHKDKIATYHKENAAKISEQRRARYTLRKDIELSLAKTYRENNWAQFAVRHSMEHDKKNGRFDPNQFITEAYLFELQTKQQNRCFYCNVDMTTKCAAAKYERLPNKISVERKNNTLCHTKANVVLACTSCNSQRNDKRGFREFIRLRQNYEQNAADAMDYAIGLLA